MILRPPVRRLPQAPWATCCAAVLAGMALLSSGVALAQAVAPGSTDPSRFLRRFEREVAPRPDPTQLRPTDPPPPVEVAPTLRVRLAGFMFDGNRAIPDAELQQVVADLLGRDGGLTDLQEAARRVTRLYRERGFLVARAVIPAQTVTGGRVLMRIFEGDIGSVTLQGELAAHTQLVRLAQRLREAGVLTARALERAILLMNDQPGVNARAVLSPGVAPGLVDVVIQADRASRSVTGQIVIDNYGSRFVGPVQVTARVDARNVFEDGDLLTFRGAAASQTEELRYGEVSYEMPLGNTDARIGATFAASASQPGRFLRDLPVDSEAKSVTIRLINPFIRSRETSVFGFTSFTVSDSESVYFNDPTLPPSYRDQLRIARLGAVVQHVDGLQGANSITVEFSQGLAIFDAGGGPNGRMSLAQAQPDFSKIFAQWVRFQSLGFIARGLGAEITVAGQVSLNGTIPVGEQFAPGSRFFGRGYDPGEITGDNGFSGRFELQYRFEERVAIFDGFMPYAFIEGGRIRNDRPIEGETRSIASAGLGIRGAVRETVSVRLEVAKPLSSRASGARASGRGMSPIALFEVGVNF